ncbi:TspO/MBR family protein [Humisphaera borealis]|uniref:Tryptophan-rich sensory protein n=1 Tax=Humisphaera borealis TaxID=2807512 RepID=A0A7M2WZG6_9BACT|nr:TspO/MBR family protein [Humisphaera borealis]QOV90876.1 tryptophan-rich sensory protein [Humisphaera borealis]
MRNAVALTGFIILCLAAGGIGGWLTSDAVRSWYPTLVKPSWNPPPWIFGPVWTTLYVMMGIAAFLVWRAHSKLGTRALTLFAIQLLLNVAWSWIFFSQRQIGWAAVEVVVLLLAIIATTALFWRVSRPAGALMFPYIAWVSFASFLNFTIWQLNR